MGKQNTKLKRGGKRPFSGAKQKYGEQTKTIAFRVPEIKTYEIKLILKKKLQEFECKK
jgi:hypothetical protein